MKAPKRRGAFAAIGVGGLASSMRLAQIGVIALLGLLVLVVAWARPAGAKPAQG
jgi:hypothetical protein